MPYLQLYYHLVWATKNRLPLLTPKIEPRIHQFLRDKAVNLGAEVFAVNGMEDHVHVVCTIPASIAVSSFVGKIKAVASTRIKHVLPDTEHFQWQGDYAAFSVGVKYLDKYIAYVANQKKHHAESTTYAGLERVITSSNMLRDDSVAYVVNDDEWI